MVTGNLPTRLIFCKLGFSVSTEKQEKSLIRTIASCGKINLELTFKKPQNDSQSFQVRTKVGKVWMQDNRIALNNR
jgi:hypothetical protein